MSDQFDKLKGSFEVFYPRYKSWVEENLAIFPIGKIGTSVFTMQEASALLLEFSETIKIVLEDKEQCLKYIGEDELAAVNANLNDLLHMALDNNHSYFVAMIGNLILCMRPFHLLSMEKMDKKRYREVSNMDKTLSEIKTLQEVITSTVNKAKLDSEKVRELIESTNKKDKEVNSLIDENIQKVDDVTNKHEQTNKYLYQINDILNSANSQKSKIDGFVNLIQEREEKITSQNVATETYEEKLKEFSEKHDLNMAEARKLIEEAHEALNLSTAIGLGKAFYTRQQKLERWWIKLAWLAMGISAVSIAVSIGYTFLEKDLNIEAVVGRSLLMTVLVAVAAFFSRQYSRNRVLEEDYAYKVALVASYPGIATEFKDAEERKEYVVKLLDEILQDPQRVRHDKESLEEGYSLFMKFKNFLKRGEIEKD